MSDDLRRIPTQQEVWKIKDRFDVCKYFYKGIFVTRQNVLPLILQNKLDRKQASKKVQDIIDNFYVCMTDNKFDGLSNLPEQSKNQLSVVKSQIIQHLLPQSFCEQNIDKLYRDLVYNKLI